MRACAWVVVASLALAGGVAHATQDHYTDMGWVAAWSDPSVIVVEMTSYSPEAEGADRRTWWSFQQPAGVEQAVIEDPYSKKPRLKRSKDSTLPADKLEAIVAGLRSANTAKPRPKQTAIRDEVAPTLGITGLSVAKKCPAKVRVGKKVVTVAIGEVSAEAGRSTIRVDTYEKIDMTWDTRGASDAPSMRPVCFPHAGGVVVKIRLHVGYEGDQYVHRAVFLPGATLP